MTAQSKDTEGRLAKDFYATPLRKSQESGVKSLEKDEVRNCPEAKM